MSFDFIISIRLMTYNHELYIREAMNGIMMQKTNFNVEVVVGDDFSTDGTLQIIKQYNDTGNIKIKILDRKVDGPYWKKRQKLGRLYNFTDILENCSGKYIALLDGDDYWTDPYKLQKQVDFLEANSKYSLSFHEAMVEDLKNKTTANGYGSILPENVELTQFMKLGNHIPTASVVLRKSSLPHKFPEWFHRIPYGDMGLYIMLLKTRKPFYKIEETMSVYSHTLNGMYSKLTEKTRNYNELLSFLLPLTKSETIKYIIQSFYLRELSFKNPKLVTKKLLGWFP